MVPICGESFEAQSETALKRPGLYRERWERTVPEAIFFFFRAVLISSFPFQEKGTEGKLPGDNLVQREKEKGLDGKQVGFI